MTTRKKLPIGLQDFEKLITGDFLYVDKTAYVHSLVNGSGLYFLSRPRRFGKSMLLSTIEALFRGKQELFEGLYIANRWDWKPQPVVRLDFLGIDSRTTESLARSLIRRLDEQARAYGLTLHAEDCTERFRELILGLAEQGQVVVLIDEYDKPILDHITDVEVANRNKAFLGTFYAVLKSVEEYLAFLLITGVSKFTRISLFSELNNLKDITLHPDYAGIAGWTQVEVVRDLAPYLDTEIDGLRGQALLDRMKLWYNGYSWDGKTRVYNPVSLLNLLDQKQFGYFWFATGTPKFLIKLLREGKLSIPEIEHLEINAFSMEGFEPEKIDPASLLFQTGYLTIKSITKTDMGQVYSMVYPNQEVRQAFLSHLLADYADSDAGRLGPQAWRLGNHLREGDIDAFCEGCQAMIATIPYNIFLPNQEAYYHTVIYLVLSLIGVDLASEIQTNRGRIDAVLETADRFYVVEFKLGTAQKAADQIQNKGYANAYRNRGKAVYALAVGIDPEQRNISEWLCVEV